MDLFFSPIFLYLGCVIGAAGVALAMPRRNVAAFIPGAVIALIGLVVILVGMGVGAAKAVPSAGGENGGVGGGVGGLLNSGLLPNLSFYVFAIVALGSALRVVTHQRPVYSALYFVLTILSSTGLYILLQAEFMAFALVIVYAGAILITYMFVIMLASEGKTEDATEGAMEYDRVAREPLIGTLAGFILLATLSTMLALGVNTLKPNPAFARDHSELAMMPERVERVLADGGVLKAGEKLLFVPAGAEGGKGKYALNMKEGVLTLVDDKGAKRSVTRDQWPAGMELTNAEGLGFELIDSNPLSIEVAGVILLMAMVGAVVLARRKVELDDQARAAAMARTKEANELGTDVPMVPAEVGGNN